MSVTRRAFFQSSLAIVGGVGLAGLASRQASAKIAPNLIGYQPSPSSGHDCAGCKLFEAPNACRSVDGSISPQGWCRMWIKA
jgi:hypothetical protein